MKDNFLCHKLSEGVVEGEVLISQDDICYYLVDPATGNVIESGHDIEGQSVAQKILVFPGGKGSSVVQADGLFQLLMKKMPPKPWSLKTLRQCWSLVVSLWKLPWWIKWKNSFIAVLKMAI